MNEPETQLQRRAKYGTNVAVSILLVLAILFAVNFVVNRNSKRFDLTKSGENTLADQSVKVLKGLKEEVKMLAFFPNEIATTSEGEQKDKFIKITELYKYVSKNIKVEFIDPLEKPSLIKKYDIAVMGTVLVEQAGRQQKVTEISEETLTNAIIKVTRAESKTIYFLEGHGEKDILESDAHGFSFLKEALEKQNYVVKNLNLFTTEIPLDASVLVVAGPRRALADGEVRVIDAYLKEGGRAFILLDPQERSGMKSWLKDTWGINVGNNIVLDMDIRAQLIGLNETFPLASTYQEHPITENFKFLTFYPLASSVYPEANLPEGVSAKSLVETSVTSWAEVNIDDETAEVEYNEGEDMPGPVSLMVVAEMPIDKTITEATHPKMARLVVSGDSDFAANQFNKMQGNGDFALNILNWLAGEEDLIAIPPKKSNFVPINMTGAQKNFVFFFSVFILPAFILTTGIFIWTRRKGL